MLQIQTYLNEKPAGWRDKKTFEIHQPKDQCDDGLNVMYQITLSSILANNFKKSNIVKMKVYEYYYY